jgi:hypothetical protein
MEIEFKNVSVAGIKDLKDEGEGIVEAIVSVTGIVDNVNDIIKPGAYQKTLAARKPKGVWHHSWTEPIAKTLDIKEMMPGDPGLPKTLPNGSPWPKEAGALAVKMEFNLDGPRGKQAYSDVKFFKEEQEWSIGYNVPTGGSKVESKSGQRHIETLDLYEYSPVLFGAMPSARTQGGVKDAQMAFKSLGASQFDHKSDEEDTELVDDLNSLIPEDFGTPKGDDETEEEEAEESKGLEDLLFTNHSVDPEKVRIAIKALQDVLQDLGEDQEQDEDEPQEVEEEKAVCPSAFYELKGMEYENMYDVVTANLTNVGGLYMAAKAFDTAVMADDLVEAEKAAGDLLDGLDDVSVSDDDGEKADQILVVTAVLEQLLQGREEKSVRARRVERLVSMSNDDFQDLDRYMQTTAGNSGIKSAVDEEAQTRYMTSGYEVARALQTKRAIKPKPGRKFSRTQRDNATEKGEAMDDGSFPITDKDSLGRAIKSVGRAKDTEAAKAHICKRAKEMGAEDMLPDDWKTKVSPVVIDFSEFENAGIDVKSMLNS